jgi:hypothetical protein
VRANRRITELDLRKLLIVQLKCPVVQLPQADLFFLSRLLDALERLDGKATPQSQVESFLVTVDQSECARQPSAGLGEDVRVRGDDVIGSGLELEGELIQLSAFRSEDGGRRAFGRIARPSRRR